MDPKDLEPRADHPNIVVRTLATLSPEELETLDYLAELDRQELEAAGDLDQTG